MPRTGDEPPTAPVEPARFDTRNRRPLLADAAITILARDGGRGLTHRAVDREAGVPEGTTKNYYATRDAILEAAAHRMADQHRAAVDQLRATTPTGATRHQLRQLYPALLRRAHHDPTPTLAMVELYLEAVRQPTVRAALATMATTNAHATADLHHTAGVPSTTTDTGLLDACLLGVLLSRLALPTDTLTTTGLDNPDHLGTHLFDTTVPAEQPTPTRVQLPIVCHPLPRAATRRPAVTYPRPHPTATTRPHPHAPSPPAAPPPRCRSRPTSSGTPTPPPGPAASSPPPTPPAAPPGSCPCRPVHPTTAKRATGLPRRAAVAADAAHWLLNIMCIIGT